MRVPPWWMAMLPTDGVKPSPSPDTIVCVAQQAMMQMGRVPPEVELWEAHPDNNRESPTMSNLGPITLGLFIVLFTLGLLVFYVFVFACCKVAGDYDRMSEQIEREVLADPHERRRWHPEP